MAASVRIPYSTIMNDDEQKNVQDEVRVWRRLTANQQRMISLKGTIPPDSVQTIHSSDVLQEVRQSVYNVDDDVLIDAFLQPQFNSTKKIRLRYQRPKPRQQILQSGADDLETDE